MTGQFLPYRPTRPNVLGSLAARPTSKTVGKPRSRRSLFVAQFYGRKAKQARTVLLPLGKEPVRRASRLSLYRARRCRRSRNVTLAPQQTASSFDRSSAGPDQLGSNNGPVLIKYASIADVRLVWSSPFLI